MKDANEAVTFKLDIARQDPTFEAGLNTGMVSVQYAVMSFNVFEVQNIRLSPVFLSLHYFI